MASPIIFSSHISGDCATPNGSAATTVKICSVERSSVSVPPMAIRLVEAKNAVPFCSAAVTCAVDHAHLARQQLLHPVVAIAVHQGVEAAAALGAISRSRSE